MGDLRQKGRGNGSTPQVLGVASAAAVLKVDVSSNNPASGDITRKELDMKETCSNSRVTEFSFRIGLRFKIVSTFLVAVALLTLGYGNGFSPSA
jgi:hypothetical protein